MRQFHVKIFYAHAKESEIVDQWESWITFARTYVVNGIFVSEDWAELRFAPFGQLWLWPPPDEGRHPDLTEPYKAFLASLTASDWLDEDSAPEGVIVIPVSRFEFIEGVWFQSEHPVQIEQ